MYLDSSKGAESILDIKVTNLSYSFDAENMVLKDVNFSVPNGHSLVLIGASGCGKTTLLNLIAGVLNKEGYNQCSGSIAINGVNIFEVEGYYKALKRLGQVGYMTQKPVLFDHMTVLENINLPSEILGISDNSRTELLLNLVGLEAHQTKYPKELSGGMQTRTALARLFSTEPKLLLLDEPFSSLDIARKTSLYNEFNRIRQQFKTTSILVTHDIFEAIMFSGNLCIMNLKGSSSNYVVNQWSPNYSYEDTVKHHFDCFSEISAFIQSND